MVVDMEAKEERKEEGQGQEQGQGQGEEGVKPEELKPKLNDKLVKGLEELGIQRLLPIQVKTWRTLLGGKRRVFDLRLCSPTGSGKTLAYALPILHHLSQQQLSSASARLLRCIVILPTRDLAQQVHSVLAPLASRVHVKVGLCCGLASLEEEATQYERERERELEDEHGQNRDTLLAGPGPGPGPIQTTGASILVATPGRLRSHLDRRTMNLLGLQFLVLDEMDRLLQQSYHECLPVLLDQYQKANVLEEENAARKMGLGAAQFMQPKYKCMDNRLIKLSVSATITNDSGVKTAKLREGFVLTVSGFRGSTSSSHGRTAGGGEKYELPENLEEFMLICSKEKKPFALLDLLKKVKRQRTLCFANATEASELIHTLVTSSQGLDGWHCEVYNSKRRNHERGAALKSFGSQQDQEQGEGTKGDVNKLLICTDGASRGIDLKRVKLVINYDMPTSTKNYVHRVGRTARAGESGTAITILTKEDVVHFKKLTKKLSTKIKHFRL